VEPARRVDLGRAENIDLQKMNWKCRTGVHEQTVYLSRDISVLPEQEDTPVSIRLQVSSATVKALHTKLQQAYLKDDMRLMRRTTVLIDMLVHQGPLPVLCERGSLSASCLYDWQRTFLLHGLDSLVSRHSGGRRPKLTPRQKQRLVELIEAGPLVVGCETACWDAVLIRVLIWREFGCSTTASMSVPCSTTGGFRFTRPDCVGSSQRGHAPRLAGAEVTDDCTDGYASQGLILFEDEASCAQWVP